MTVPRGYRLSAKHEPEVASSTIVSVNEHVPREREDQLPRRSRNLKRHNVPMLQMGWDGMFNIGVFTLRGFAHTFVDSRQTSTCASVHYARGVLVR